jgi:hypothetical protein
MSTDDPNIRIHDLGGHAVRVARIGETDFVAVQDFCTYLQGLVGKIVELTTRQQEQMTTVTTSLDVLYDVLAETYPDLQRELLRQMQRRSRLV